MSYRSTNYLSNTFLAYCKISEWSEWTDCGKRNYAVKYRRILRQSYEANGEINTPCSPRPKLTEIKGIVKWIITLNTICYIYSIDCESPTEPPTRPPRQQKMCELTSFGPWTDCRDDNKQYRRRQVRPARNGGQPCTEITQSMLTESKSNYFFIYKYHNMCFL